MFTESTIMNYFIAIVVVIEFIVIMGCVISQGFGAVGVGRVHERKMEKFPTHMIWVAIVCFIIVSPCTAYLMKYFWNAL